MRSPCIAPRCIATRKALATARRSAIDISAKRAERDAKAGLPKPVSALAAHTAALAVLATEVLAMREQLAAMHRRAR